LPGDRRGKGGSMKRRIPCFCENAFTIEVPDEIDLDKDPSCLNRIMEGSFMSFSCPSCGKKHKPEFPLTVLWVSKKLRLEVFTELDRGEFYRRKKGPLDLQTGDGIIKTESIISYPEMADRLAVIRDGFEPAAVEAIKYYLYLKAEESYPDDEVSIWYSGCSAENSPEKGNAGASHPAFLEFHIHGIKEDEVAVTKIPRSLYEKTLLDYRTHPKNEIFLALRVRTYLSVKNTMRPEVFR
jgi:hypothetical protein